MKVKPIIDRLKAEAATFGGRVAGAADFSAETEAARLGLPCAFVLRAGGGGSDAATVGAIVQLVNEEFGVIVAVNNSADERGQAAAETLDDVLDDVVAALLGWAPDAEHNPFEYVRDDHLTLDRGRLWHQITFRTSSVIASLD
jgi:hypothetical protein